MTWLNPEQVAERLSVSKRTALNLMAQMPHSVIGGTQRKRIRVSEEALDTWMLKQTVGDRNQVVTTGKGTKKKLQRR